MTQGTSASRVSFRIGALTAAVAAAFVACALTACEADRNPSIATRQAEGGLSASTQPTARSAATHAPFGYPARPLPTTVVPFADSSGPRTYVSKTGGYAVAVPPGWYVEESGTLQLTSYDVSTATRSHFLPGDESKIEIRATEFDPDESLAEEVDSILAVHQRYISEPGMCDSSAILVRETWNLGLSTPALRVQVDECGIEIAMLAARIGKNTVVMVGFGNLAPFDGVARSLRAID